MKKLLLPLLPVALLAKSFLVSEVPLPQTYIENLDPYVCDEVCLKEYLDNGQVFSFLAYSDTKNLLDPELSSARTMHMALFHMNASFTNNGSDIKIAMILPTKRIGKYAASTMNAAFAYLMTKHNPFELKSYSIASENAQDVQNALQQAQDDGFNYIIAPMTPQGIQNLIDQNPSAQIYVPTLQKDRFVNAPSQFIFGGINYKKQIDALLEYASAPLVIFSDKSSVGKRLAQYQQERFFDTADSKRVKKYFIGRKTTNLAPYLKYNRGVVGGTFFINTPIVKTSMILSQLTLYDTYPQHVLSTQINYNPLLLTMTQYTDRKNLLIANSLTVQNDDVLESNDIVNNNIAYDWINYSTTVGVDYFFSLITGDERVYDIPMDDNQMLYDVKIVKPLYHSFSTVN